MFRVSKAEEWSRTMVTLDGQLSSDYIEAIETCCHQAMSAGKPVHVFLRDVSSVDPAGRDLLRRLAAGGVHLPANGIYNSYLVRALAPAGWDARDSSIAAEEPGNEAAR